MPLKHSAEASELGPATTPAEQAVDTGTDHDAKVFYERLVRAIKAAEEELVNDEGGRKAVPTCRLSGGEVIALTGMGYHNPDLILLHGIDHGGNVCTVAAHLQTVQVVIRYVKPSEPEPKRRTMGFQLLGSEE